MRILVRQSKRVSQHVGKNRTLMEQKKPFVATLNFARNARALPPLCYEVSSFASMKYFEYFIDNQCSIAG